MKPDCKEIEQQLSESRREFWAADATINNLELKLADMAAHLANAEKRIAELESLTAQQLTPPSPVVTDEMTPEMMRAVQLNSELGAYAASNLSGAYDLFSKFWKVACRAAMLHGSEPATDNTNQQFESLSRGDK